MMFRMELDALNAIVKELREIKELLQASKATEQPQKVVTPRRGRGKKNDHE